MAFFNKIFLLSIVLSISGNSYAKLSIEDFTIALNMMRDGCMDLYDTVTLEKTENLRKSIFPDDDKDLKCYAKCIWDSLGAMKNGKFDPESTLQQVELLVPKEWQEDYRRGIHACRDAGKELTDDCEHAYAVLKCFIPIEPNFYFP